MQIQTCLLTEELRLKRCITNHGLDVEHILWVLCLDSCFGNIKIEKMNDGLLDFLSLANVKILQFTETLFLQLALLY